MATEKRAGIDKKDCDGKMVRTGKKSGDKKKVGTNKGELKLIGYVYIKNRLLFSLFHKQIHPQSFSVPMYFPLKNIGD